MENMNRRVAAVTGATGAIGCAIAESIARLPDWEVVLIVRDRPRGESTAQKISRTTGSSAIRVEIADLGVASDITSLRQTWRGPLHALVNNAAVTPPEREQTAEDVEAQWGVNFLGYWRMAKAFHSVLSESAPSRLVNVASYWAGGLDLDDPEFKRRRYDNDSAYRQSKQADRMLSVLLADSWNEDGISVNACHPGDVRSRLSRNLGFGGSQTPAQGADTPSWLATAEDAVNIHGMWVSSRSAGVEPFAAGNLERLESLLESYG
ncbi:MAG: SDR family NAD(P)-dependent oxidoreductase [Spirochaetaceae bacterium]|nr:SDR family NAD(P)-dependent oxidoreductase [Spirochaetaceae bacterium]